MNVTFLKKQDGRTITFSASFSTAKNVAADISEKLCDSVATKLEGKVLGTFSGKKTVQKPCFRWKTSFLITMSLIVLHFLFRYHINGKS